MLQSERGVGVVTPGDLKEMEGRRLLALMAAMGALPGGALLTLGPSGAPLFAAALVALIGAYMFWLFTDGVYYYSQFAPVLTPDETTQLHRSGYRYQATNFAYAAASVLLSLLGMVAEHGGVRLPIAVATGMGLAVAGALGVAVHVWIGMQRRNALARMVIGAKTRQEVAGSEQEARSGHMERSSRL